jgi:hypothetical protein
MRIAQSHHIQAYDYDPETKSLVIQFVNGSIYQYRGVDKSTYYNFVQSPSQGMYLHSKIRGQYPTDLLVSGPRRSK